jgi:murein L,D-transpeptidase YcbB/YkuD
MRHVRIDLAAVSMLALIAASPALAAPERIDPQAPLPPALNNRGPLIIQRRETVPVQQQQQLPAARQPQTQSQQPRQQAQPQHNQQQLNAQQPMQQRREIVPVQREAEPVQQPIQAVQPVIDNPARAQASEPNAAETVKAAAEKLFAASDEQISAKLKEQVAGKQLDKRYDREPERKAMAAYYQSHNFAPIWIRDGRLTQRAETVIARLKNASADGLDAQDYAVPEFGTFTSADALADGDIKLTYSVLTYARHLSTGRIAPRRVLAEVDYGEHTPEPADILKKVVDGGDANAALDSYNPPHAGFRALKEKLAELRGTAEDANAMIPDGPVLKPGMKDGRVAALREKLGIQASADETYDVKLAKAVQVFQKRSDIQASGNLDSRTIAALNGPKQSQKIDRVLANMERWRWLPRDLGRTYVMVNVPDYTLKVMRGSEMVWTTKIVAGKPQTPTPLTSAPMDHVIMNPSWYVPQSIIQNELLSVYDSDPKIFERMGLEVKRGPDGNINVVQPPGAANALGRMKFAFPNKFQVYLHDTPEKRLFAADKRAFSHGCMRVENPTKFGEVILAMAMPGQNPSSQQLANMFGREEYTYKLVNRPMVHLTYQTAFVKDGKLELRDDIYGFDSRIHSILHSDERRVADVEPPKDPKRDLATLKSNQEILRRVERREAANPLLFFERLFR